jgi:hypothetical protein
MSRRAAETRRTKKRRQEQQRALREDRKRVERTRRARAHEIANAWSSYETCWGLLSQSQGQNQRQPGGGSLMFEHTLARYRLGSHQTAAGRTKIKNNKKSC